MEWGTIMKVKLSKKQIIATQILSIIFAVVQEILKHLVATYEHLTMSIFPMVLMVVAIIVLLIFYAALIGIATEANWENIIYICIPFIFYCGLFSLVAPNLFKSGIFLAGLKFFINTFDLWFYQWIGVFTACVIGIGFHKVVKNEMIKIEFAENNDQR